MKKIKIVNGYGMHKVSPRLSLLCIKNSNGLWDLILNIAVTGFKFILRRNEKLEVINKITAANDGVEFIEDVEENREKEKSTDKIDINQICERIDFVTLLIKDIDNKIDEYAKESKIDPLILLNIMQDVLDSEKGD